MALKLLCAGCGKDERERAETAVRQALGRRTEAEAWTVSLVKMAGRWSITLDAPAHGVRALTFAAPDDRLRETIANALSPGGPPAAAAPHRGPSGGAPAHLASGAASQVPYDCEKCRRAFVVHYDALPDEGQDTAPVACPHCWHVNHVLIGENAAETKDYRAEKV
jgi:DNA-directed RNA polymerase subunit RPC12/RpoP